jgi:hypothetical protein
MTIRKTGAADGRITEAEPAQPEGTLSATAAVTAGPAISGTGALSGPAAWGPGDEDGLAAENEAADQA